MFNFSNFANHRGIEQSVARWAHNPKVAGSSPAPATKLLFSILKLYSYFYTDGLYYIQRISISTDPFFIGII